MRYFQKIHQIIFLPFLQTFLNFWRLLIGWFSSAANQRPPNHCGCFPMPNLYTIVYIYLKVILLDTPSGGSSGPSLYARPGHPAARDRTMAGPTNRYLNFKKYVSFSWTLRSSKETQPYFSCEYVLMYNTQNYEKKSITNSFWSFIHKFFWWCVCTVSEIKSYKKRKNKYLRKREKN